MRLRQIVLMAAVAGTAVSGAARADIIELKNGMRISGTLSRQGDVLIITGDDGKMTTAAPGDLLRVQLVSNLTREEAAAAEWERTGAQIRRADDLQTVIALHEKFLKQYPDVAPAEQVKASLGVYQRLADSHAVKFRGRWMALAQVEVTMKQWVEDARPLLAMYRGGQLREVLEAVKGLLVKDDQNPEVLAIAGLAAYRLNNLALARNYFTSLSAADPTSVLAENNLAVIAFAQKQMPEGLTRYTKALQIMPGNRLVLDNIAEALNTYLMNGGEKNGALYKGLLRQYEQAETKMEAEMGRQGLQRWGSTWVKPEELAKLEKYRDSIQDQMGQLDAQFKGAKETLVQLDNQIKQAQIDIDQYNGNITYYTAQLLMVGQGRIVDASWASVQLDAAQANLNATTRRKAALEQQRAQLVGTGDDFQRAADQLKAAQNGGLQYSGVQRVMDVGEDEKPPAPAVVQIPAEGAGPMVVVPPTPVFPPQPEQVVVPVPVPVYVVPVVPGNGGRGGGRGGRGGRGG